MKLFFLSISFAFFAMMLTLDYPMVHKVMFGVICAVCALTSVFYDKIEASE